MRLIALLLTVVSVSCLPIDNALTQKAASPLQHAVDVYMHTSQSTFTCLKQNGYTLAFIRGWITAGPGNLDPNVCANIKSAQAAGLMTEIYLSPSENFADAKKQFDYMYQQLLTCGSSLKSIWIQVTDGSNYFKQTAENQKFFNTFVEAAAGYGLQVGIYTNQYYYEQILGTAQSAKPLGLWYFKTNACGKAYDTPDNFGDFVPFDGFKAPSGKQFASCEAVCGTVLDRDVFAPSGAVAHTGVVGGYVAQH